MTLNITKQLFQLRNLVFFNSTFDRYMGTQHYFCKDHLQMQIIIESFNVAAG